MENLPEWVPLEAFNEFLLMRKKIKKPMTPFAMELAVKNLDKLRKEGNDPQAVLEQSIFNSWQGLFAVKQKTTTKPFKGVK